MTTTAEAFLEHKSSLEATVDDEWLPVVDRADACLQLAQLLEKDLYQRARWVQVARDLLKKDFK